MLPVLRPAGTPRATKRRPGTTGRGDRL